MTTTKTAASYLPEVRERAVRLVLEGGGDHPTQWAAISSVSAKIGCTAETLRKWVRQAERDGGQRPGPTGAERERIKALEREVWELRQANEILARPARILPWRSSTAGRGHDRIHRRSPRGIRGRADLQGAADRPVDLPRPRGTACRSGQAASPRPE